MKFEMNRMFCDAQIKGPFKRWEHCHVFRSHRREALVGTLIRDEIEYELPLHFIGDLGNALFVKRQIDRSFAWRHKMTEHLLEVIP